MADDDREINARVIWSQQGASDLSQTAGQMTQNWRSYNGELTKTETSYRSLRMAGRELSQLTRDIALAGALMTGAIVLDANNYVKAFGQTSVIAKQWLAYTDQIKNS